jgi:hypothetical protein
MSQLREIINVVLPMKEFTIEDILRLIQWKQACNHQAYLSHRKQKLTKYLMMDN